MGGGGGGTTLELILCLTGADVGSVTDCFDSHTDNRHINHCGCWEPGDPARGYTVHRGPARGFTGAQPRGTQRLSQWQAHRYGLHKGPAMASQGPS